MTQSKLFRETVVKTCCCAGLVNNQSPCHMLWAQEISEIITLGCFTYTVQKMLINLRKYICHLGMQLYTLKISSFHMFTCDINYFLKKKKNPKNIPSSLMDYGVYLCE